MKYPDQKIRNIKYVMVQKITLHQQSRFLISSSSSVVVGVGGPIFTFALGKLSDNETMVHGCIAKGPNHMAVVYAAFQTQLSRKFSFQTTGTLVSCYQKKKKKKKSFLSQFFKLVFLLLFVGIITFFNIIYKSHYIILTKFQLYLQYFQ